MELAYQQPQKSRRKILRPTSTLNLMNLANGSRISKISSHLGGNNKHELKYTKPLIVFKQNEITEQLQKQILAIEECLITYKPFLEHIKQKQKRKSIRQQIFSLQDFIKFKDEQINTIAEEVKHLKNINNSSAGKNGKNNSREEENNVSSEQLNKYSIQETQENNIFKLAEELKNQRQFLEKLQNSHKTKQSKLSQITHMVIDIEQKFIEKCQKTKQRPLRYEEFKELNEQKKKEVETKANKRLQQLNNRQKQSSIKEMQFNFYSHESIRNQKDLSIIPNTKKSLKDLQNRKIIAQQALKNATKKHNHELRQLMAKIQFLRDQDTLLLQKIREKEDQKNVLEARFNEQKGSNGSFHLHSHRRMMSPSNRSSHQNRINRLEGLGMNAKLKNMLSSPKPMSNQKSLQQHHFSPHRRLLSPRKGLQQFQIDQLDTRIQKNTKDRRINQDKSPFEDYDIDKYDDYEERTFNPNSKNSNKQSSTIENDSHDQRQT